jgi:hypothetical protein
MSGIDRRLVEGLALTQAVGFAAGPAGGLSPEAERFFALMSAVVNDASADELVRQAARNLALIARRLLEQPGRLPGP